MLSFVASSADLTKESRALSRCKRVSFVSDDSFSESSYVTRDVSSREVYPFEIGLSGYSASTHTGRRGRILTA